MAVSYLRLCTSVLTAETYQTSKECHALRDTAVTGSCWDILENTLCKHFICLIKYCFSKWCTYDTIYSDVSQ